MFVTHAQARCANSAEQTAINMRALQSELMVAALACGQRESYNSFVKSSHSNLAQHGRALRGYFQRQYGTKSEYRLNKFVTQMANQASRVSLNQHDKHYCTQTAQLFNLVRSSNAHDLITLTASRYVGWHDVNSCDEAIVANAH